MPTYDDSVNGLAYSEALKEAYAVAPVDVVILHTLEIYHPTFVDDDGNPTAARIVRDNQDMIATLENTAIVNGGEQVLFKALPFDFILPSESDNSSSPELTMTIDNVSRELVRLLNLSIGSTDLIQITYRPYLSTDLTGPHINPPLTLTLRSVNVSLTRVTAKAGFQDFINRKFPKLDYTNEKFPGLQP